MLLTVDEGSTGKRMFSSTATYTCFSLTFHCTSSSFSFGPICQNLSKAERMSPSDPRSPTLVRHVCGVQSANQRLPIDPVVPRSPLDVIPCDDRDAADIVHTVTMDESNPIILHDPPPSTTLLPPPPPPLVQLCQLPNYYGRSLPLRQWTPVGSALFSQFFSFFFFFFPLVPAAAADFCSTCISISIVCPLSLSISLWMYTRTLLILSVRDPFDLFPLVRPAPAKIPRSTPLWSD